MGHNQIQRRDDSTTEHLSPETRGRMRKKSPDTIDVHVGSRLRRRRLMLGMTQTEVATTVGVKSLQLHKYEKGQSRVTTSRLQRLSHVLQVPVSFFFEGASALTVATAGGAAKAAVSPAYVNEFLASSDGLALSKAFMCIPSPKLRRTIVRLVEQIAAEDA
jgi:transcriptional regulator with XRE-family HTH domain